MAEGAGVLAATPDQAECSKFQQALEASRNPLSPHKQDGRHGLDIWVMQGNATPDDFDSRKQPWILYMALPHKKVTAADSYDDSASTDDTYAIDPYEVAIKALAPILTDKRYKHIPKQAKSLGITEADFDGTINGQHDYFGKELCIAMTKANGDAYLSGAEWKRFMLECWQAVDAAFKAQGLYDQGYTPGYCCAPYGKQRVPFTGELGIPFSYSNPHNDEGYQATADNPLRDVRFTVRDIDAAGLIKSSTRIYQLHYGLLGSTRKQLIREFVAELKELIREQADTLYEQNLAEPNLAAKQQLRSFFDVKPEKGDPNNGYFLIDTSDRLLLTQLIDDNYDAIHAIKLKIDSLLEHIPNAQAPEAVQADYRHQLQTLKQELKPFFEELYPNDIEFTDDGDTLALKHRLSAFFNRNFETKTLHRHLRFTNHPLALKLLDRAIEANPIAVAKKLECYNFAAKRFAAAIECRNYDDGNRSISHTREETKAKTLERARVRIQGARKGLAHSNTKGMIQLQVARSKQQPKILCTATVVAAIIGSVIGAIGFAPITVKLFNFPFKAPLSSAEIGALVGMTILGMAVGALLFGFVTHQFRKMRYRRRIEVRIPNGAATNFEAETLQPALSSAVSYAPLHDSAASRTIHKATTNSTHTEVRARASLTANF